MRCHPSTLLLLLLGLFSRTAWADNHGYALDPVHTRVAFTIGHAGFSQAIGTVSGSTGTLEFDPQDWHAARIDVSVPMARIDLGDSEWNRAAQARNLLDTEKHPAARFVSTRIEPVDAQHAVVFGDLTLHGVTRETRLEVTFNQLKRHPLPPFRRTAGFSATATIRRSDFGIDAWKSVIGDEVQIRMEVEAVRSRAASGNEADDNDNGDETPVIPESPPDNSPMP